MFHQVAPPQENYLLLWRSICGECENLSGCVCDPFSNDALTYCNIQAEVEKKLEIFRGECEC